MALGRLKTWIAETLTASDLNAEFNNILNNAISLISPLTGTLDANGNEIVLDADGDSSITVDTDDRVDVKLSGIDLFRFDGTATTPVNGLDFVAAAAGSEPSITAQGSDTDISITLTPKGAGTVDLAAAINHAEGAAVASATTTDIWATDGNTVHVTGTTTITSLGTAPNAGAVRWVIFDGALTLTHAANLNLPGSANITTAAGDFARVYADTTTQLDVQYFKADGSAITGGGVWEQIGTATASASATVEFTWSTTYKKVMIVLGGVLPATVSVDLWLRTSTDGGSTFDSGASDYSWTLTSIGLVTTDGADSEISLSDPTASSQLSNTAGETYNGNVEIFNPSAALPTFVTYQAGYTADAASLITDVIGVGRRNANADVDGVQFLVSSGNIASGEFTAYGLL